MLSAASTPGPAIDLATFQLLNRLGSRGGNEPFAVRVARLFLKSSPVLLAGIHRGYAAQNCAAVYIAAHNLMASSRTLGALELARLASDLESMAHAKLLVCAETLVMAIEQEFRRVCEALEKLIPAPAETGHT